MKEKIQSYAYWFNHLPESVQKEFKKNCGGDDFFQKFLMREGFESSFFITAFYWGETPQGHKYWERKAFK